MQPHTIAQTASYVTTATVTTFSAQELNSMLYSFKEINIVRHQPLFVGR